MPVEAIVLINAMIPLPGETAGEWWGNTGSEKAQEAAATDGGYGPMTLETYFLHDVPAEVAAELEQHAHDESEAAFASVCDFEAWPAVPTRVLAGEDDRFFPVGFQRTVARDRLGLDVDVLPGGHLMVLSQPNLVAGYLMAVTR